MAGSGRSASDAAPAFPAPFAAPQNQSWRDIGASLRTNALAAFSWRAFEELSVARGFAGRQQIILSDPEAIRHILIENADNYRRTAATHRLLSPVVGRGVLLAAGEDWRRQRRAAAPALAPRMMPDVARTVAQVTDRLVDELIALEGGADRSVSPACTCWRWILPRRRFSRSILARRVRLCAPSCRHTADGLGRPTLLDFLLPRCLPSPFWFARRRFRRRWMAHVGRVLERRRAEPIRHPPRDLFDMMREAAVSGPGPRRAIGDNAGGRT